MTGSNNSNAKMIRMLWTVVAVLLLGLAVGGFLLVHKANDLQGQNAVLSGDVDSLQNQVKQLKASSSSSPSPSPSTSALPATTPSPTSSGTPQSTIHPVPTPN